MNAADVDELRDTGINASLNRVSGAVDVHLIRLIAVFVGDGNDADGVDDHVNVPKRFSQRDLVENVGFSGFCFPDQIGR